MTKLVGSIIAIITAACAAWGAGPGDSVVVVFNKNLPESKKLAEYYAQKRGVPARHLFGVDVSATSEDMSRPEFRDKIQKPLFDWLVKEKLFTLRKGKPSQPGEIRPLSAASIRYIVLSYGIPLKIVRDTTLKEEGAEVIQEALRGRNEAAVDADLALLPVSREKVPLTGPIQSPYYLSTNTAAFHPTNNIVMVARLDGPTVEIARGLVDKALEAETNGLWGRAYFDARGMTNGDYRIGDDWMRGGAEIARRLGFETTLDDQEPTFAAAFPMSQIAFYAGWYDANASGPFAQSTVEFMPGAFAYHLHSFSANTVRSRAQNWVGPLLAKGATITMGAVTEPYLAGTPNVAAFLERLILRRFTFGEAAYASQGAISWQTTVVGDPLYQPFGTAPDVLHFRLEREKNPLVEWSHLRVLDLNQAAGAPPVEMIKYLSEFPLTKQSAVLMEKLGDLHRGPKPASAVEDYNAALKLNPSPLQKIRLLLGIAEIELSLGRNAQAFDAYKQLVTDAPDYPNVRFICQQLADLARRLGKTEEAEKFAKQAEQPAAPK
jgi:uncharacterized protein (TIGR03790 family)